MGLIVHEVRLRNGSRAICDVGVMGNTVIRIEPLAIPHRLFDRWSTPIGAPS